MNELNTGGPAFPVSTRPCETEDDFGHQDSESTWQFGGMTLRDYFAAKAINRIGKDTNYENLAKHAYAIADAMLKARGEK